jgi:hypothetical protein
VEIEMRLVYISATVCMIFGALLSVDLFTPSPDPSAQAANTLARIVEQSAQLKQDTPGTMPSGSDATVAPPLAARALPAQTNTLPLAQPAAAPSAEQDVPEPRVDRLAALPAAPAPARAPASTPAAKPVRPISTAQEFTNALNAARARKAAQNDAPAPNAPEQLVTRAAPALDNSGTKFAEFAGGLDAASFEALMASKPKLSPVEGLHKDLWEDKSCKSCHRWTVSDLCVQASKYAQLQSGANLRTQHPNGRDYASALANWHAGGCE